MNHKNNFIIEDKFKKIDADLHYFELYCNGHNESILQINIDIFKSQFTDLQSLVYKFENYKEFGNQFNAYSTKISKLLDLHRSNRFSWAAIEKYYGKETEQELVSIGYHGLFGFTFSEYQKDNVDYRPSQKVIMLYFGNSISNQLHEILFEDVFKIDIGHNDLHKYEVITAINNNANTEFDKTKLKWLGKPAHLALIIDLLIEKGYLEATPYGERTAEILIGMFDFTGHKPTKESLGKILHRDNYPINDKTAIDQFLKIPRRSELK